MPTLLEADSFQVSSEMQREISRLSVCDDPSQLIEELVGALEITVEQVVKMAAIIRRLDELGVEITIPIGPLPFLRRIAYGQMMPELFVNLQGDTTLLERVSTLPRPDQERVSQNKPFKVMSIDNDHRMVPPLSMTRQEIKQVFGIGKVRDDAEQVGILREQIQKSRIKQMDIPTEAVKVNKRRGGVEVGKLFIPRKELARYLAELG